MIFIFYLQNIKNKNTKNKKNNSPYRKIIKNLIYSISEIDIDTVKIVSNINPDYRIKAIEDFCIWVQSQGNEISYSEAESQLKSIYLENGFERLYYIYLSIINNTICEELILKSSHQENLKPQNFLDDYDEFLKRAKVRSIIATICLFSIVFNEDLLTKKIFKLNIKDDFLKSTLVKELRVENISILNGLGNIPILISEKETDLINKLIISLKKNSSNIRILEHLRLILTHFYAELSIAMYCMGSNYEYYLNNTSFSEKEAGKLESSRFYPVPCEVLSKRKLIPPDEGVILKLKDHPNIESIYLNECTRFGNRIIYGVGRFFDGYEFPYSLIINNNPITILFAPFAEDILSTILDFYKIFEDHKEYIGLSKSFSYDLLSASYWKYRTKGYKTASEKINNTKYNNEHPLKITTYIRSTKGNASKDTLSFAQKIHLIIEDHQTIVKEKNRFYNRALLNQTFLTSPNQENF